jgi:hypothetical protein
MSWFMPKRLLLRKNRLRLRNRQRRLKWFLRFRSRLHRLKFLPRPKLRLPFGRQHRQKGSDVPILLLLPVPTIRTHPVPRARATRVIPVLHVLPVPATREAIPGQVIRVAAGIRVRIPVPRVPDTRAPIPGLQEADTKDQTPVLPVQAIRAAVIRVQTPGRRAQGTRAAAIRDRIPGRLERAIRVPTRARREQVGTVQAAPVVPAAVPVSVLVVPVVPALPE